MLVLGHGDEIGLRLCAVGFFYIVVTRCRTGVLPKFTHQFIECNFFQQTESNFTYITCLEMLINVFLFFNLLPLKGEIDFYASSFLILKEIV